MTGWASAAAESGTIPEAYAYLAYTLRVALGTQTHLQSPTNEKVALVIRKMAEKFIRKKPDEAEIVEEILQVYQDARL